MGCSRQYVYKLVNEGKLSASRISSRMAFIRKADIEKMLAGNSQLNHISAKWRKNASVTCKNPSFPEKYINNCRLLFINVSLWNYFIIFMVKI